MVAAETKTTLIIDLADRNDWPSQHGYDACDTCHGMMPAEDLVEDRRCLWCWEKEEA